MATIDASQWDETICDMIACQHPPCWEAIQRIVKGQPRIMLRSLDSPEGDSPEPEDELPTLKIVDLPLNYSQRDRIRCAESLLSISKTLSSIKGSRSCFSNTTLNNALMPPISRISSERYPFPGLNSRMETRTSHFTPISFTCLGQAEKIQVTDFSEFAVHGLCTHLPPCGSLVVTWVPDRRRRLLRPEKPAARGLRVKDLASETTLMVVEKKEMKRKKSNKVPTGGQPYLLHLRKKPKEPANLPSILAGKEWDPKGSLLVSKERDPKGSLLVSKERDPKGSLREKSFSSCHSQLPPVAPPLPRCKSLLHLENRRGGVAARKEELESLFTVQKAPSAKIPMKENLLRRTPSRLKFALRDSVAFRRPMPMLAEQQEVVDPPCSGGGGGGLPDKAQLYQEGISAVRAGQISQPAENSRTQAPAPPPATAATAADGQKPSVKFESHKSSMGALYMEADREFWLKRVAQKPEKTLLQFQSVNPPPPPPSPLMSETSE